MSDNRGLDWMAALRTGRPLSESGIRMIDAHAHLGPYFNFYVPHADADTMVAMMERMGTEQAWITSIPACGADIARGNDMTAAAVRKHPQRFLGYAAVNPHYPERIRGELERSFDELGLCMIKVHPSIMEYSVSGPGYEPAWRFAAERHTIVLSHTWTGGSICAPGQFGPLAKEYPDVTFILGHSGGTPAGYVEAIEVAQRYSNIYLDLCRSVMSRVWVERIVTEVGPDRVVWGTDFPFIDPIYVLGRLASVALSDEAKRKVFGETAAKLREKLV